MLLLQYTSPSPILLVKAPVLDLCIIMDVIYRFDRFRYVTDCAAIRHW